MKHYVPTEANIPIVEVSHAVQVLSRRCDELVAMRGTDEGIVIVVANDEESPPDEP